MKVVKLIHRSQLLILNKPFIRREEVVKMLKDGVTLDKVKGKIEEKSRFTFMKNSYEDSELRERRMTRQEYNSLWESQADNYANERINERMLNHQSNLMIKSKSVWKESVYSKTPNNFKMSINTDANPEMSINEDLISHSIFESTPRFKFDNYLSSKIKSRNRNKEFHSAMNKSSLDRITVKGKDYLKIVIDNKESDNFDLQRISLDQSTAIYQFSMREKPVASISPLSSSRDLFPYGTQSVETSSNISYLPMIRKRINRDKVILNPELNIRKDEIKSFKTPILQSYRQLNRSRLCKNNILNSRKVHYISMLQSQSIEKIKNRDIL